MYEYLKKAVEGLETSADSTSSAASPGSSTSSASSSLAASLLVSALQQRLLYCSAIEEAGADQGGFDLEFK